MRTRWMLDSSGEANPRRVIDLVTGPHPYLWFGEMSGECFGTIGGTSVVDKAALRSLRDELTKALRHASKDTR